MANFFHEPIQNIQDIRRLLSGYEGLDNFLKEIVQNAEDSQHSDVSEANTLLALHYFPKDKRLAILHPLLSGPCLCIVNNGKFNDVDRRGIFTIGSGTKGDDPSKIGRFGLGLKSIFEYCDAFFLVSSNFINGEQFWFLNPYEGWKHDDWTEKSKQDLLKITLIEKIENEIIAKSQLDKYLAFFIPLRKKEHCETDGGNIVPIIENYPGDQIGFVHELVKKFELLCNHVVLLRSINKIQLCDHSSNDHIREIIIKGERICRPNDRTENHPINGGIFYKGNEICKYQGISGRLNYECFENLKKEETWPKTINIKDGRIDIPEKGEPHFACVVVANSNEINPLLTIEWNVFLPIGTQLDTQKQLIECLNNDIKIILHGSFFPDETRTQIYGLNTGFNIDSYSSSSGSLQVI